MQDEPSKHDEPCCDHACESSADERIAGGLERGAGITIHLDGRPIRAYEGESVAAALLASELRVFRTSERRGEPRGPYCGMGSCFECVMTVDGRPNVRTCREPVREGMRLSSQRGLAIWEPSS